VYLFDSIFYLRPSGVYWTLPSRVEFHRQHEILAVCGTVSFVMIFLDECFAKVFLNLNLFFITTTPVSLMCQRLVDFYEPIYHRLLSRFHTFETPFSLLFKVFKKLFQFVFSFQRLLWNVFKCFPSSGGVASQMNFLSWY